MKSQIRLMLILIASLFADQTSAQKFFIRFTDKANSVYSTSDPAAFLSARAIARRAAHSIPVTEQDLPVNQNYIDGVLAQGAGLISRSKWFNGITVVCDSSVLANILTLPYVVNITKVIHPIQNRSDSKFDTGIPFARKSELMTPPLNYGTSFNQINLMNGEYLHNNGYTGTGMVIAVLDAGFYSVDNLSAFDSLRNRNGILGTWDFVDNNSSVYEDDTHGMEVLSTIAGNVPGELVGTAPDANFWLLRTEDVFSENIIEEYNWAAGAEFADSVGADVISSSLGYSDFDDSTASHTYADMDGNTCPSSIAADIAFSKGILVVTSAGNSGNNFWHYISAPADGDSVLAVGAVDSDGNYVSFSSYGPSSDGDIKPNVAAKGANATVADPFGTIGGANGTSFSCPILAGAATCLLQAHPGKSVLEVKNAIERSANYFNTPTDTLGYGIPNFGNAHFILSGIEDRENIIPLIIYPNPILENLYLQIFTYSNEAVKIQMIDLLGKVVAKSEFNTFMVGYNIIDFPLPSDLSQGIYLINIKSESFEYTRRVIKN
ncbi:MAG: S8 family serine peptidase [Bacteroidetes bacterium]|nr:S8 family serine peptidase [Bacteroidota bacterium]MBK9413227.1 S8 family serine peptidase [Bacteroidota bacterium]MBL0033740.1 S8 family serine peptidase [Bacteroidota bacterium]MBP6426927.1 S8 family serine peptidase [Bacteroidia bacterium]MBP6657169.1 S8 family serine peptidase [Bacteroidia bacterium]